MGRVAFALGTPDCGAGVVDGSASGLFCPDDWSRGDSALGPRGTRPILPEAARSPEATSSDENPQAEQQLNHIWLELSVSDRQRFGHCFSFLVLKALGLR